MSNETKSEIEKLLLREQKPVWQLLDANGRKDARTFADDYKSFIGKVLTERLAIEETIKLAEAKGFRNITTMRALKPGDRVYYVNRKKNIILAVIGKEKLTNRVHLVASHVDSPRIDLKVNPVAEDEEFAILRTHYYGGIKKYQWVNIPLALVGIVAKKDGSVVEVAIGLKPDDPVFMMSDLLPHLSEKAQGDRKMREVIKGEELLAYAGVLPIDDEAVKKNKVKLNFLKLLFERYKITESDFLSAELSLVPVSAPCYVGLDKGLLAAYGHDDRICAYTSLRAILELQNPNFTALCYFADKEEIGSEGNTGAQCQWLTFVLSDLLDRTGENSTNSHLFTALSNMRVLSSDVNVLVDPVFKSVHEPSNAGHAGYGVIITKYTGAGGKYNSNDANAEYMGYIRKIFDEKNIVWQTGQLGKVDEGGGGTIAKYLAKYNAEVIDIGTGLIGMHAPFELCHIGDLYMTFQSYRAFYNVNE